MLSARKDLDLSFCNPKGWNTRKALPAGTFTRIRAEKIKAQGSTCNLEHPGREGHLVHPARQLFESAWTNSVADVKIIIEPLLRQEPIRIISEFLCVDVGLVVQSLFNILE